MHYLSGGEIEAVPMLPLRPIHPHEVLVIKLGEEGEQNTVEVRSMVHETTKLVPMRSITEAAPNTFIAVDVRYVELTGDPYDERANDIVRLVGSVITLTTGAVSLEDAADPAKVYAVPHGSILAAYWAPLGYRSPGFV